LVLEQETVKVSGGRAALVCGVLGVVTAFVMYWMVLPGLLFGLAAIVLGWRARRGGRQELGSVAMTLGVVAILLVPAFLSATDNAEGWGRDCALHPEADSNC
jgi:hypothetical protein